MAPSLSPRTKQLVEIFFSPRDASEASQWLEEECGNNLPSCGQQAEYGMERIPFAAIKLSKGNIFKLLKVIDEARMDWRDLLIASDFGYDVDAHENWAKGIIRKT